MGKLVLFVVALVFLQSCDPGLTGAEHVSRAKQFMAEGDIRASVIELKNALQINPGNAEARFLLGEAYVDMGMGMAAEKELRRALALGVEKEGVAIPMARALLYQGKYQILLDEITAYESLSKEDRALLVALRGDAWLGLRKLAKAEQEYHRALAIYPDSPEAKLGLAKLIVLNNGGVEKALALVDEAISVDPDNRDAWSMKGDIYFAQGIADKAVSAYTKAVDLSYMNVFQRANRGIAYVQLKDDENARRDAEFLMKNAKDYYKTWYLRGLLHLGEGEVDTARDSFEKAVQLTDHCVECYYYLGLSNLLRKNLNQAWIYLERFVSEVPGSLQGRKLAAWVAYLNGQYQRAYDLLFPVVAIAPEDKEVARLYARISFALGKPTDALDSLEHMVEVSPDVDNYLELGLARIYAGESDQGIADIQKAVSLKPESVGAKVVLTLAYLNRGDLSEADALITEIQRHAPNSPIVTDLRASWLAAQGKYKEVREVLKHGFEQAPDNLALGRKLAAVALRLGDMEAAREAYSTLLKYHPTDPDIRFRLALLARREGKLEAFESALLDLIGKHPAFVPAKLSLAHYYLRYGRPNEVLNLARSVLDADPGNLEAQQLMVLAQIDNGQVHAAVEGAKHLAERMPQSPNVHFLLATAYHAAHDDEAMSRELEATLRLAPDFAPALFRKVQWLIVRKRYRQAQQALDRLLARYPDNVDLLGLQGALAAAKEDFGTAQRVYAQALKKAPSTALVTALAGSQWNTGNEDAAITTLESWHKEHPQDVMASYLLASLYQIRHETSRAREVLEELVARAPEYVPALNDLAWMLRGVDEENALAYARRAYLLAPASVHVADTLASILMAKGRADRAVEILQKALRSSQGVPPRILYHLALAQSQSGATRQAREVLRNLLAETADFPDRDAAATLLERLDREAGP